VITLFIKGIEKGAEYNNQVYDFWIDAILEDESEISIFDFSPFDLRPLIGKKITCAIELFGIDALLNSNVGLKVKFLGEVVFPNLDNVRQTISGKVFYGFENINGIFYISSNEISEIRFKVGDEYIIDVARYDLLGYNNVSQETVLDSDS
jgi:hypothetical protein